MSESRLLAIIGALCLAILGVKWIVLDWPYPEKVQLSQAKWEYTYQVQEFLPQTVSLFREDTKEEPFALPVEGTGGISWCFFDWEL